MQPPKSKVSFYAGWQGHALTSANKKRFPRLAIGHGSQGLVIGASVDRALRYRVTLPVCTCENRTLTRYSSVRALADLGGREQRERGVMS